MLRIDLAELIRITGKYIDVVLDETPVSDEDITYLAPAAGLVTITNSGSLVLVRGHVTTVIHMECSRCLTAVRQPIDAEIEEQFTLSEVESATHHGAQVTLVSDEENELPEGLMDGTVMDLNVVIRQAVILNSPISVVCKEECLGLCPDCGANRNDGQCDCHKSARNTPLAGLKALYDAQYNDRSAAPTQRSDDDK